MKKVIFLSAALFSAYLTANAQWTTAGNEIYNSNSGIVVIRAIAPNTGGQKLVVNPLGAGSITLGEANTGVGGHTSLTLSISAYQNGYASLQSIKASGSAYGVLSLNPGGGNVGIGTDNPGSFKLAVEGKIGAREIKVMTTNPWPDYVFRNRYQLRSLASLEKYIDENKHLPGIPSAAEVKEEGGIELGEMNRKLVEKIEELTLYIIELNKKIEKLEKEKTQ